MSTGGRETVRPRPPLIRDTRGRGTGKPFCRAAGKHNQWQHFETG